MSKPQDSQSPSEVVPTAVEPGTDDGYVLLAGADGNRRGEARMDDVADLGGHTLLCRSPAPQGRRSLFRR